MAIAIQPEKMTIGKAEKAITDIIICLEKDQGMMVSGIEIKQSYIQVSIDEGYEECMIPTVREIRVHMKPKLKNLG